jgi:hypothetical protein
MDSAGLGLPLLLANGKRRITQPHDVAGAPFHRPQPPAQAGRIGSGGIKRIEEGRCPGSTVGNRRNKDAEFVDQSSAQHGAIDLSAPFEKKGLYMEPGSELVEHDKQFYPVATCKQIRDAAGLKMGEVVRLYLFREYGDDVVAADIVALPI